MGTRGDVQPYIFLAQELTKNGVDVTLGSHPCWRKLIEDSGVHFVPVGQDIDIEKEAAIIRGKNKNPIFSMLKTMNFIFRIIVDSTDDVYMACQGMDLIIVSHAQMGATEASVLGIPTINVTLQTEMIPQKLKPQSFFDRLFGGMIAKQIAKPYKKIRKKYHLKPVNDLGAVMSPKLDLIPISAYVKERNPYWEKQHVLTGFWYQEDQHDIPDEKIEGFLNDGEKPILLALGAMSFESESEKAKLDKFVHAFEKTGHRALIQGFHKTLQDYPLPKTMMAIGSMPHSYLFPKCQMVIHHCGFGTASATLIYGVPSIPVPHVLDQQGFANTLVSLGVSGEVINGNKFTENDVIAAIVDMDTHYEERLSRVKELSKKIQEEKGLEKAAELICQTLFGAEKN